MGLFDIFKKKTKILPNTQKQEGENAIANSPVIKMSENNKPTSKNKRCCARCGVDLNLLKPEDIILNDANNKEYCDICAEKLTSKKKCTISVGTRIILQDEPICTPDMGGYPGYIKKQLVVRKNGYMIITITRDFKGDETYKEEFLENGFFTEHPTRAAVEVDIHNARDKHKVLELLEYDKKTSEQSL